MAFCSWKKTCTASPLRADEMAKDDSIAENSLFLDLGTEVTDKLGWDMNLKQVEERDDS